MIASVLSDPAIYPHLLLDAQWYFLIFGVVMLFGGIMGYVKARSVPSLVAGGISGFLFILSALANARGWYTWMVVDLILSLLLAGRFFPSLLQRKYNPAGYVVPLAIIGVIVAAVVLTAPIHV